MYDTTFYLRLLALVLCMMAGFGHACGQDTQIFVEETDAPAGEEFLVNIRALDIGESVGIQFSVNWNVEELRYLGVDNLLDGNTAEGNFNYTKVDTGRLGYLNFDMNLQPLNIADSSIVFSLRFEPLVANGGTSAIGFDTFPMNPVATNMQNERFELRLEGGQVRVVGTNATVPNLADDPRFTVQPNPMTEAATISARLDYASTAELEVLDASGRVVLQRSLARRAGPQHVQLSSRDLPAAGTYILRLTTDREQLHRRLVFTGAGGR